jgi:hypothetical protein
MPMEAALETSPLCVVFIILVERVAAPRASLTANGSDREISRSAPRRLFVARTRMTVDEIISAYQEVNNIGF